MSDRDLTHGNNSLLQFVLYCIMRSLSVKAPCISRGFITRLLHACAKYKILSQADLCRVPFAMGFALSHFSHQVMCDVAGGSGLD